MISYPSPGFLDPTCGQIAFGHERRRGPRKPVVLVVDDEAAVRDLLEVSLTERGLEVLVAASGFEAVQVCMIAHVDVVVADIKMPGMGGLEVLAAIRRARPSIRCCLMTGKGVWSGDADLGADAFISKPFTLENIARVVWRLAEPRTTDPCAGLDADHFTALPAAQLAM